MKHNRITCPLREKNISIVFIFFVPSVITRFIQCITLLLLNFSSDEHNTFFLYSLLQNHLTTPLRSPTPEPNYKLVVKYAICKNLKSSSMLAAGCHTSHRQPKNPCRTKSAAASATVCFPTVTQLYVKMQTFLEKHKV